MARTLDSAYSRMPPLTETDFYIAKGLSIATVFKTPTFVRNASYVVYEVPYDGPDRGPAYLAGLCIAMVGVLLITGARLGVRLSKKTLSFGADDVLIIPAALCAVGYYACYIHAILNGLGKHEAALTYKQVGTIFNDLDIAGLFLFAGVLLTAGSITLFNRRLTGLSSRKWMIAHYMFLAIITSIFLTAVFGLCLLYGPNKSYFSAEYRGHNIAKINFEHVTEISRAILLSHVIIDLMLLCVPIVVVFRTQLAMVLKIRLSLLFALGAVHCSMGILGSLEKGIYLDPTWDTLRSGSLWNLIDITSALVVASLPVLNSLLPTNWFIAQYLQSITNSIRQHYYRSRSTSIDSPAGHSHDHHAANRIDSLGTLNSTSDKGSVVSDKSQHPLASNYTEKDAIGSGHSEKTANILLERSPV